MNHPILSTHLRAAASTRDVPRSSKGFAMLRFRQNSNQNLNTRLPAGCLNDHWPAKRSSTNLGRNHIDGSGRSPAVPNGHPCSGSHSKMEFYRLPHFELRCLFFPGSWVHLRYCGNSHLHFTSKKKRLILINSTQTGEGYPSPVFLLLIDFISFCVYNWIN